MFLPNHIMKNYWKSDKEVSNKTIWLKQINIIESRLPDLNQQHLDLQSNALPIELRRDRYKWDHPDLNRSLRLPKPKGSTKLPYGPNKFLDNIIILYYHNI